MNRDQIVGAAPAASSPSRSGLRAGFSGDEIALTVVLALVAVIAFWVRVRLLALPFERDEGEYAYAGQLILQGVPPYTGAYNMKLPGVYYAYALIMLVFGQTIAAVHTGLIVINFASILGIFFLARRIGGRSFALLSASFYVCLSLDPVVQGIIANAEHFAVVCLIWGIVLLLRGVDQASRGAVFAGGILLGLAFLMKQHAAAFFIIAILILTTPMVEAGRRQRALIDSCIAALGALVPLILLVAYLAAVGVLDKFKLWAIDYAVAYVAIISPTFAWPYFLSGFRPIVASAPGIWLLVVVGWLALVVLAVPLRHKVLLFLLLPVSFIATMPGFYFRDHYFLFVLPAAALVAAAGVSVLAGVAGTNLPRSRIAVLATLTLIAIGASFWQQRILLFQLDPEQASRAKYGLNPFPESLLVARYVAAHTRADETVAVIGSEPQIYFYAQRRAATGYIYMYPLMEPQPLASSMQREMIREIEAAKPRMVVTVSVPTSWLMRPQSDQTLLIWADAYLSRNYELVGMVDILNEGSHYVWDASVLTHTQQSRFGMGVFRRKGN